MKTTWKGPVAILVLLAGLFSFSDVIMPLIYGFFIGLEWLLLGVLLVGFGYSLHGRLKGKKERKVWVGSQGYNVPLAIDKRVNAVHVQWARRNYWLVMLGTGLFGPGMLVLYLYEPEKFNFDMPLVMQLLTLLLWGVAWGALASTIVQYCFYKPALIISSSSIKLMQGSLLAKTVWRHEVTGFVVTEAMYTLDDMPAVPNYTITVHLADGDSQALCITDKRGQIDALLEIFKERGYEVG